MLFESKYAAFRVVVRKEMQKRHPVTGDVIETIPAIRAEFGRLGEVYDYINPETGETQQGAAITGHFYDTDVEALQNGWDDDTKAMVERRLLGLCQSWPEAIKQIVREIPATPVPWPTYDSQDAKTVIEFAVQLGLVDQALAYERENLGRPTVIDGLTAAGAAPEPAPETVEPVTPAVESEAAVVGAPALRTINV